MPTTTSFTALGKGNGFPFTCKNSTDAVINAFNGHQDILKAFIPGAADTILQTYRVREVSLTEAMGYIWNLYQVTFASVQEPNAYDPDTIYFNSSETPGQPGSTYGIFKYSGDGEGYVNSEPAGEPYTRVCNNDLDLPLPRNTYFPFDNGDGGEYFAQAIGGASEFGPGDYFAQFTIRAIYYATDTQKYYMLYSLNLLADDAASYIEDIPFSNLSFHYYTY